MPGPAIAERRLANQHLTGVPLDRPEDVVGWLGAVQAQDYSGAKWAIGQRTRGVTDADLDRLFADGAILRTHLMRPTWHFVLPADIRWMLALTSPRVQAANAAQYRQLELDQPVFRRSNRALAKALAGGRHLTRTECATVLRDAGIGAVGIRLGYLMMQAELDGVICSGARRGKRFTYALLDQRAPTARNLERDQALAELATRYFTSHGPALLQDFGWWSGLTMVDAKKAVHLGRDLAPEVLDGKSYWSSSSQQPPPGGLTVHLLPNYDEFLIAYRDRRPSLLRPLPADSPALNQMLSRHVVVVKGQVVGGWRSLVEQKGVSVESRILASLGRADQAGLQAAVRRYGRFLGRPVRLVAHP